MSDWSWNLFASSNKKKYLPDLNALEQQRFKQIETLKTCFPRADMPKYNPLIGYIGLSGRDHWLLVEELTNDIEYRIILTLQNDERLEIYVFLPPNFPNEVPVVSVLPKISHAWVNDQMIVIGCDAINNFYMHSNLGKALKEVCKQFQQIPPLFYQNDLPMPTRCSTKEVSNGELVHLEQEQKHVSVESINQTNFDGSFDISQKLDSYNLEELNELNDHPEKILEFTSNLQNRAMKEREDQISNNEKIARENLEERLPRLEAARQSLLEKYEELTSIRKDFDVWSLRQNELCETHTAVRIKTALQGAAAQADQEAEDIAEEFLNEKISIDDFISKYMEHRKFSHLRHWKEDNVLKL